MPKQAVIGLIGGMSWESSAEYYRIINQEVRRRLGGVHSARALMWSVDFGEIEHLQHRGDWDSLTEEMKHGALRLERGGADFILICTNTMHRMADEVASAVAIPLLHIADPTAEKIRSAGFSKVGLLGTAFTMEQDFYKGRLSGKPPSAGSRSRRPGGHSPGHLRRIGCGQSDSVFASRLQRDHCSLDCERRRSRYSGLHGDHAAGIKRRQRRSAF
jgi:hypothetical protein